MPKFTVKMVYTTTVEADSKEAVYMEAEKALNDSSVIPELFVTRYKTPKTVVAEDTRTEQLFPEEKV